MFKIEEIDPIYYRKQTRKATLIVMAIFIVIGFFTATMAVDLFGEYSSNHLVLNFMGAFVGLLITAGIVKVFFADKEWMKEGIYAWRLKRNLMYISNVLNNVKQAVEDGDQQAMKILRFYHLGLEQMHRLEDNNQALIDVVAEKRELEDKMQALELELNQVEFDFAWSDAYKNQ
ncbi:hypothetical protein THMIRHAM_10890 [Thiomicrorhabdus immobilis]|uniref:DUF3087 domain-containing protein n=1 Tax=Thiomicrorhabdus immobilis TaxID=2791037 RepID=A0ABM7MD05_9GAMM|nr:DUF3087 family protein [Thiomicrorhabdus immobilis]BCN93304.1 hypothetical protein THMIRHAM_10890 [Thiomicrorhabdus immobilis]